MSSSPQSLNSSDLSFRAPNSEFSSSCHSLPDLVAALFLPSAKLPFLRRLMRLLVHSGVFAADNDTTESAGTYRLTPLSWLLVEGEVTAHVVDGHHSQVPVVLAGTSRHFVKAVKGLVQLFRKDVLPSSSFEEVHGTVLFEESMVSLDHSSFATVLRECSEVFQGVELLTDCRGGSEGHCRGLPAHHVAGDMFRAIPPAQAVMLKAIRWTVFRGGDFMRK
uniref:O-methyltransferase dimerisation domain-containing protein n=1 Tax=Oryza punctata TaxID=4537 RepID=A0A0E0MEV9_ORYPU